MDGEIVRPKFSVLEWDEYNVFRSGRGPLEVPEHSHPEIQIAVRFHGVLDWSSEPESRKRQLIQRLTPGAISIAASNEPHKGQWNADTEMAAFYLNPEFVNRTAYDAFGRSAIEIIGQCGSYDSLIQQLGLATIRDLLYLGGDNNRLYVESIVNVLTGHLIRYYTTAGELAWRGGRGLSSLALRQALAYIQDNLEGDLSVATIADAVVMSSYRFAFLFRESMGVTPHQYVIEQRVERAKRLLSETDLSIADISYRLGFASQSHFTAVFRKLTQVTPKQYRQTR